MPIRKQVKMGWREEIYLPELLRGIWITARHFGRNLWGHLLGLFGIKAPSYTVTVQYPEERFPVPIRYRTLHRLTRHPDGSPRCTACMCCETICPAECIYIVAGEYPDRRIEKYPVSFRIDLSKCVFCGFCVEACPEDAIRMDTGIVEISEYDRGRMMYEKGDLLALEGAWD